MATLKRDLDTGELIEGTYEAKPVTHSSRQVSSHIEVAAPQQSQARDGKEKERLNYNGGYCEPPLFKD